MSAPDPKHEPPTLPLPPLWRLAVALAAVVGFLYFVYSSYEADPEPPAPKPQSAIERDVA